MVVRGSDDAVSGALRAAYRPYVLEEDRPRTANYSLFLSNDPATFHRLYRGDCLVLASPDPERVVAALVRHLGAHRVPPDGLVPVQALALIHWGHATLAPTLLEDDLRALGRRLDRCGIQLLDTHAVLVDIDQGEIVVGEGLGVDHGALASVVGMAPRPRRNDPPVPDGRYPIRRWMFMDFWQSPGAYSRATATRRAALVIRGGPMTAGEQVLDRLARLFETVAAEGIDPANREEVMALLRSST